jgi:hypothetical protein
MTLLLEQLESRLPRSASDASKHNLRAVFSIADSFKQRADAIRNDQRLTYAGKDESWRSSEMRPCKTGISSRFVTRQ